MDGRDGRLSAAYVQEVLSLANGGAEPGGPFFPALYEVGLDPYPEVIGDRHPHRGLVFGHWRQGCRSRRLPGAKRPGHLRRGAGCMSTRASRSAAARCTAC